MKIVSWNCQGAKTKGINLEKLIKIHQPDIIYLQETQLNPTNPQTYQ